MSLREEFEKETGMEYLEEYRDGQHLTHNFRPAYVKWLEQKLSLSKEGDAVKKDLELLQL